MSFLLNLYAIRSEGVLRAVVIDGKEVPPLTFVQARGRTVVDL
jgi:hypothetical protein